MGNYLQTLPQADPELLRVLFLVQQAQNTYCDWLKNLPVDHFWKSYWKDIDSIDFDLMTLKCDLADLVTNNMLNNLEKNI